MNPSTIHPTTHRAMQALGKFEPSKDWRLEPHSHADKLPKDAENLAVILRKDDLKGMMAAYEKHDKDAIVNQARYKRMGKVALILHAVALMFGGSALVSSEPMQALFDQSSHMPEVMKLAYSGVPGLQFAMIILAVLTAQILIRTDPYGRWMRARAEAETLRGLIFRSVFDYDDNGKGRIPLLPLQLEYFRRYMLEVQHAYYSERGAQHKNVADSREKRRNILTTVATFGSTTAAYFLMTFFADPIGTWLTQFSSYMPSDMMSAAQNGTLGDYIKTSFSSIFLWAGIIASSIISLQTSLSYLSQDERNASRYLSNSQNLIHLIQEYLQKARAAAAEGDKDAVMDFVNTTSELIQAEHTEWVSLQEDSMHPSFETIAASRMPRLSKRANTALR